MIQHIAFIMDGNRRWAKKQGLQAFFGHKQGAEAIKNVVEFCLNNNIKYTSLYTFSIENFNRSQEEVAYLFDLLITETQKKLSLFLEQNVRVRFIGDKTLFPSRIIAPIEDLEEKTKLCNALNLNFLFCYGARQEIVSGIKKLFEHIKTGLVALEDVTEDLFKNYLWTGDMPEPELIVRTSGIRRLSNFLLYQSAYSEFYFLDCLWPEITQEDMNFALQSYIATKRNFGQ